MSFLSAWFLGILGCSGTPSCDQGTDILAEAGVQHLTCAQADVAPRYIVRISGRGLAEGDRGLALAAVRDRFLADPNGTKDWLDKLAADGARLEGPSPSLEGAERLSHAAWVLDKGQGLITHADEDLWNLAQRSMSIWARDDEEQLALTENDVEGWIRYMSLCREAQGADTLKLSVADRVTVYSMVVDTWNAGAKPQQVALAGIGPFWSEVRDRWQAATYEQQQAWVRSAPLPPPMTSSSLGYAETVLQGDVSRHALVLHEKLGPFSLGYGEPPFAGPGVSVSTVPAPAPAPAPP